MPFPMLDGWIKLHHHLSTQHDPRPVLVRKAAIMAIEEQPPIGTLLRLGGSSGHSMVVTEAANEIVFMLQERER